MAKFCFWIFHFRKPVNVVCKTLVSFSGQEPAFQELILLYTKDFAEGDTEDNSEAQALQLKIYERIPIPDLPVNIPKTSMSVNSLFTSYAFFIFIYLIFVLFMCL